MKYLRPLLVVFVSLIATGLVYWKLPVKGLLPFPGDLLTGRFFPWNTQRWEAYPNGVPYKEFIAADAVRQTFPWRKLAIEQLKQGNIPWWNPYAFSGTPLLANLQTAAFYPLNLIYWLVDIRMGWVMQVMMQPVLSILLMYLFLRSLGKSIQASWFGGVAFAFSGYMMVWLELNTVAHAALWLPFVLWSINKGLKNTTYFYLTVFGLVSSLFAGHIQSTIYIGITTVFYYFTMSRTSLDVRHHRRAFITALFLAGFVSLIQLLPAWQLYTISPRVNTDKSLFEHFLVPIPELVTLFAPNYFGNPATNNFTGSDYGEFMAYFGVIPLLLVFIACVVKPLDKHRVFFIAMFVIGLLLATKNPIATLPYHLHIPVLGNSAPARILFLTQFAGVVLASCGLDYAVKKRKLPLKPITIFFLLLGFIWLKTLVNKLFNTDEVIQKETITSIRNLVLPTGIALVCVMLLFFHKRKLYFKQQNIFVMTALISIQIVDANLFANKYLPFSEPEFFFPESPIFNQVQLKQDVYRFFGDYTASVNSNTWMPYSLYSPEGYDSLYVARYGELLAATANEGKLPSVIPRSDANLKPNQDDPYRQRLQDLLGVKYILDKNDHPQWNWEPDVLKFPENRYQLIWQEGKFKIYENKLALARARLVPTYQIIDDNQTILDRLFDPEFDPNKVVIVEQTPSSLSSPYKIPREWGAIMEEEIKVTGTLAITNYSPNEVIIQVDTPESQILVLSDVNYPGWRVFIDGNESHILRANYAFRSTIVPAGLHEVRFVYKPF